MNLFYTKDIDKNSAYFDENETRHLTQVLRKKQGDRVCFTDGKGGFYDGEIVETHKKTCVAKILNHETNHKKRPYHLHIAIAPTKNIERLEWFLEKSTEIGIDEITLLRCHHSEREQVRLDRLNGVLLAAMKQSLQTYLPKLHELTDFNVFIQKIKEIPAPKFIAHCNEDLQKQTLNQLYSKNSDTLILIGPEGDFSAAEISYAKSIGFQPLSLGKNRLRTETAGLMACQWVFVLNQL